MERNGIDPYNTILKNGTSLQTGYFESTVSSIQSDSKKSLKIHQYTFKFVEQIFVLYFIKR